MPLMVGALSSLWLEKILLAVKKMHSPDWLVALSILFRIPLDHHIFTQAFHEFERAL